MKLNYSYTKLSQATKTTFRPDVLIMLLLFLFASIIYLFAYSGMINYIQSAPHAHKKLIIQDKHLEGFVVNTPGCKIPDFHPFDKQVKPFIYTPKRHVCNKGKPALFESNLTSVYLLNSSLSAYNITDKKKLKCCYNVFWRTDPKPGHTDDDIALSGECYNITERADIDYDFIRVTCRYEKKAIYKDMFSFVPINSIKRLPTPQYPQPLNVLLIGLDAVSRLNLHRQLGKTVQYIKSLGAIELLGYNKVGDNTFPNLIPVLAGASESELTNLCYPNNDANFDNCSFIWKDYKEQGYVTAYGEDSSWMGLFNYQRDGFIKQPTDYGYSYFSRYVEHEIGNAGFMNVDLCQGARWVYRDFQEYIKKFAVTMKNNDLPYFGLFWGVSLSHDDLNMPKLGDEDYYNFFKFFKEEGILENTVLIFLSDHGIRWGNIRETYQGRMEERLPFVFVLLPDSFKSEYPQAVTNLVKNTRRLTSPFDLHETLVDLLNPNSLTDNNENETTRGISLFRKISENRTCQDAGIVSHWCTCQQSVAVSTNTSIVIQAANFAVKYINNQLVGYAQCANLTLSEIFNAMLMTHKGESISGKNRIQDYMISFKTKPGDAVFETTIRYTPDDKVFSVIGSISRLNLYGKQSLCISDFHLKLYCFCKKFFQFK